MKRPCDFGRLFTAEEEAVFAVALANISPTSCLVDRYFLSDCLK